MSQTATVFSIIESNGEMLTCRIQYMYASGTIAYNLIPRETNSLKNVMSHFQILKIHQLSERIVFLSMP
jgi:hypothetical protein